MTWRLSSGSYLPYFHWYKLVYDVVRVCFFKFLLFLHLAEQDHRLCLDPWYEIIGFNLLNETKKNTLLNFTEIIQTNGLTANISQWYPRHEPYFPYHRYATAPRVSVLNPIDYYIWSFIGKTGCKPSWMWKELLDPVICHFRSDIFLFLSSSSWADSTDSLNSLTIHPYLQVL